MCVSLFSHAQYRRQMIDTSIALLPILVVSTYFYGLRVLVMAGIGVAAAVATDYLCLLFQKEYRWKKYDYSAFIAGLTYVLMLPASAPYWLVVFGVVFAVVVVRHPFGGHYNTLFNPAMTAFAFVTICWTDLVTHYPTPFQKLPLTATVDVPLNTSPAYRLMLGGANSIDLLNALLGNFNGPMGTTCIAVLLCCGLYLAVRRTIIWQIPVATLGLVALSGWLFPRVNASHTISILMELTSGVLIFAVIFVAAMDNGEIETSAGKWICGLILGGLVVLFRQLSKIELVAPFAIIITNTIDHRCDAYARHIKNGFLFCVKAMAHGVLLALTSLKNGVVWCFKKITGPCESFVKKDGKGEKKK